MPFPKLGAVTEAPKKVAAGAAIGAGGIAAGLGLIASSPLWTIPVLILGAKLPQIALDAAVTKIYKKDVEGYIEKYKSSRSSPKSITCGDAGDEIAASRADLKRADSAFKTIEVDKQNISLSDNTRNLIQTEFSKISSTTALKNSLGEFKKSLEAANEVIKADQATDKGQPTNDYSSVNFKSLVSELKGDVVLALEKQQKDELTQLSAFVQTPDFKNSLTAPNDDATKMGKAVIEQLKTSHTSELKEFNTKVDQELKLLLDQKGIEDRRLAYLGFLSNVKSNKKMLIKKSDEKDTLGQGVGFEIADNKMLLLGIKASEIEKFETESGKTVSVKNGSFSVESSKVGFAITKADLQSCALGVKALLDERVPPIPQDKQTITTNVRHDNPEKAKKLAKMAYEAALEAGFLPKNITINLDGKKMSPEDLDVDVKKDSFTKDIDDKPMSAQFKEAVRRQRAAIQAKPTSFATVPAGTQNTSINGGATPTTISGGATPTTISGGATPTTISGTMTPAASPPETIISSTPRN